MKKIFILRRLSNATVTKNNFDIIAAASKDTGAKVHDFSSVKESLRLGNRNDLYVATASVDVIKLYLSGRRNIAFWIQGIIPEESMLRNRSYLRYYILSLLELMSLRLSSLCLPVSNAMIEHYNNKYHYNISHKSYVFPCFNTTLKDWAFDVPGKYERNCFIYAGGLAKWQCFSETLDLYKKIESSGLPETKLIVMTKAKEVAIKEIKKRGIMNFEVDFTSSEELPEFLSKAKFGFVLRKENPINFVSTPTKISSYLSCGVIPICGSAVKSFLEISKATEYAIIWDGDDNECLSKISAFPPIDKDTIKSDYGRVFDTVYSFTFHQKNLSDLFAKVFNINNLV